MLKKDKDAVELPDVEFEDVADCYTFYVNVLGVSEDVFWTCDIAFIKATVANKNAFEKWMNRQRELKEKNRKKH